MLNEKEVSASIRGTAGAIVGIMVMLGTGVLFIAGVVLFLHAPMILLAIYFATGHSIIGGYSEPNLCVVGISILLLLAACVTGISVGSWDRVATNIKIAVLAVLLYVLSIGVLPLAVTS